MTVRCSRVDGVVSLTLDRPDKRNAVTIEMWGMLESALGSLEPTDEVVVFRGARSVFSSGSDVSEFLDPSFDIRAGIESTHRVIGLLATLAVPTVAVVSGLAAGSALGLALSCDFVLASEDATFCEIFARRGLAVDSGASWLLPRLVGDRRARELILLGEPVDAPTALEWGLITAVVPSSDLEGHVIDYVSRLRAVPALAHRANKALLAQTWIRTLPQALDAEAESQMEVLRSDETRAAVSAFTDRRRETSA